MSVTVSTDNVSSSDQEVWRKSRRGAWAARGFDYQHLVFTLILVRQWAGVAPSGHLVPEGFDDCVIELDEQTIWLQAKSRHNGKFHKSEVDKIRHEFSQRVAQLPGLSGIHSAIVLEQPLSGMSCDTIEELFDKDSGDVFICSSPNEKILALLTRKLDIVQITAEGIANELYRLVAETSGANASLSFEDRRRISTNEVERRILDRLEAEDSSAIHEALSAGALALVDFNTQVPDAAFYKGVKVRPGHIAAGLAFERTADTNSVITAVSHRKHVLITGPSGSGKSALVWLTANKLSEKFRWFEITGSATATDAHSIIRFIRSRRPTQAAPIGIAFDDIGSVSTDLWNVLVRELRGYPAVYLIGSIRREDLMLISNQSDTEIIPLELQTSLAEAIWQKLFDEGETTWTHWQEPFEQSEGLLLEYVHILTQGQRLAAVVGEQVRQRELENRDDELAIIRSTAVLCGYGGEIQANRLFQQLNLGQDAAAKALKRLLDEHIVAESSPGILGGLHLLRSRALAAASHDELAHTSTGTLWRSLSATTHDTMPMVLRSVLSTTSEKDEQEFLSRLASFLCDSQDVDDWTAVLTGLGLATLERYVSSFTEILEAHEVPRAQWSLAAMYGITQIDLPETPQLEQLQKLRKAIRAFGASAKYDLRTTCLEKLPSGHLPEACSTPHQANRLFSCLVPICGTQPEPIPFELHVDEFLKSDIQAIAELLSTVHLVSPTRVKAIIEELGGEHALLDLFHTQTPWTTTPSIQSSGEHGSTIRSNWFYQGEEHNPDPHETVCQICEILIALSPDADAAACDAIDPSGNPVTVGDFKPWSKNMPRANIPAKSLVAWNVAFRQILLARVSSDTLTDYVQKMMLQIKITEKLFRTFTEKWIQGRSLGRNADAFATQVNEVIESVNALAYASPNDPSSIMTDPAKAGDGDDMLGALLTGVLGNLLRRLGDLDKRKATATFAGSLAEQAREHCKSDIWRMLTNAPLRELSDLKDRLRSVSNILHELSHDPGQHIAITRAVRGRGLNKSIAAASRKCVERANHRLNGKLRDLTAKLKRSGLVIHCHLRPISDGDTPYWPRREIAILVEFSDLGPESFAALEGTLVEAKDHFKNDWPFRVVPVMNGLVLADFALYPSSVMPIPDSNFVSDWSEHLSQPICNFVDSTKIFDEGIAACHQVSAISNFKGSKDLHEEEKLAMSHAKESFDRSREAVAEVADSPGMEHWQRALEFLVKTWGRVVIEHQELQAGKKVSAPLCKVQSNALLGPHDEHTIELADLRLELLQFDLLARQANSNTH